MAATGKGVFKMRYEIQYGEYSEILNSIVSVMARCNELRSKGWKVRVVNADNGFVISDWS